MPPKGSSIAAPGAESPDQRAETLLPTARITAAVLAALAAAWIAAGSTGLLGHPLRHAMTWICLAVSITTGLPTAGSLAARAVILTIAAAASVLMNASPIVGINVASVALVTAILACSHTGANWRALRIAATATAVFAVFGVARTSIPAVWLLADSLGGMLARTAGHLAGEPCRAGATFAGVDFLVLMAAFTIAWLVETPPPRRSRAAYAVAAILAGHLVYLVILAYAPLLRAALPETSAQDGWSWAAAVRQLIPWNLPLAAGAVQLPIAAAMLRWSAWPDDAANGARFGRFAVAIAATAAAALLPFLTACWPHGASLQGKKIVCYEKGFLNWLKAEHGQYGRLSIGMYGMLPTYIESLGAKCVVSPDLAERDLRDADALILLYPNKPWEPGQLERIRQFVQQGGGLLVMGEHTVRESDGGMRFNEVLAPTKIRVPFDTAVFEVGGWLQSYEALAHPATAGVGDDRNQFGVVIGASVDARWPAQPLLVGRFGFIDPGDAGSDRAMLSNEKYDAGEKLGDVVLAAEQALGKGKIIAFGDTSSLTNGITVGSHVFTSRLLAYLADGTRRARPPWRQGLGMLAAVVAALLLLRRPGELRTAAAAIALAASLHACRAASAQAGAALPDGRLQPRNNLAYIDSSHLEASSDESWRPDGTMGLAMTLMRNGYLTLTLPEFTRERLERAAIVVSIAPARAFTKAERDLVREFVERGGIFICTVGYEACGPSRPLLADFGFHIGGPPGPDGSHPVPEPLGHFKAPYVNTGDYMAYVRFHAAWPVVCTEPDAQPIAYGPKDSTVIIARRVGQGRFVVVGDTCFAMNKNLEREGGEPFEGMRENADFWRWFLTYLTDQPRWIPPNPAPAAAPTTGETADAADTGEAS